MMSEIRGWGTVRPYRDGYRASIYVGGKRQQKSFPKKKLAEVWLNRMREQKVEEESGGRRADRPDVTVAEAIPEVWRRMEAGSEKVYTQRTLGTYKAQFARLERECGAWRVRKIRNNQVAEWVGHLRAEGLSSSSIRHLLDRLSQVAQHCLAEGYIRQAPKIPRPRLVQKSEARVATDEEYGRLIRAARDDWDRRALPCLLLAGDAGLRVTEIANLRGGDIRLGRREIRVAVRGEQTDRTKSGKARTVPILTDELAGALEQLPRKHDERLFGVRTRDGIYGILRRTYQSALDREPAPHELRHRLATALQEGGEAPAVVQALLGHGHIQTTQRYTHTTASALSKAAGSAVRKGTARVLGGERFRRERGTSS